MGIRKFKPTTPGRRQMAIPDFAELTTRKPCKSLLAPMKKSGGRKNTGQLTVWHRGGGHKRRYRVIDFRREKLDIPAKVATVEYDPNRSARIALLHYADGEKRYILAPKNIKVGATVLSSDQLIDVAPGNAMLLKHIPTGVEIHNIELKPGKGGQMVRSAGNVAVLEAKEGKYAQVRLPSGKKRLVALECRATVGQVGNVEHENITHGKAGRRRWLGRRPRVRAVAMNPVDHPMGGGEGKASGGRHPCDAWGRPAKGFKTRRNKRTDKYQVK